MSNKTNKLPAIPAKRYFSLEEAAYLADLDIHQIHEWQQREGIVLGKGTQALNRLDVIKLRQMRHGISDYFSQDALDSEGNPVISAVKMREKLQNMLQQIQAELAK